MADIHRRLFHWAQDFVPFPEFRDSPGHEWLFDLIALLDEDDEINAEKARALASIY